jgi:CubicO group peptidase (beta-lactamase class C family)
MGSGGLSARRLARLHDAMAVHVESGTVPGLVTLLERRGETHIDAIGALSLDGNRRMPTDAIFRIASMTKLVAAAAAMILVEEGRLRLDDPVDSWLPELADRRVLTAIDAPLGDTEPAKRPITLRDLLTFRMGIGAVLAPPWTYPIQRAMLKGGLTPGPNPPERAPEEWLARLGELPLIRQPGEAWMYHTGSDVAGILIARASGQTLAEFLAERIFDPLGMVDTGFWAPPEKIGRMPTSYLSNVSTGGLAIHDRPETGRWSRPPVFESGGGGLVSTAADYAAFCRMLLQKGQHGATRILSRSSVELMTTDQLTEVQRAEAEALLGGHSGWGFGAEVNIRRDDLWMNPGRFGWTGGIGTCAYVDPREELIGVLLTQRMLDSPGPPPVFRDFWTSVYQAIDD